VPYKLPSLACTNYGHFPHSGARSRDLLIVLTMSVSGMTKEVL
jgi:hypothetical protein